MSRERGLDVTLMGREFRVSCPEDEQQALLSSVEFLDNKMRQIRDAGKVIGIERIAIMAALNITHEYLTSKVAGGAFDVGEFKRRIKDMETMIAQAMAEQENLF